MEACPICLQPCSETGSHSLVELKCSHKIGKRCIKAWLERDQSCPLCRESVILSDVYGQVSTPAHYEEMIRGILRNTYRVIRAAGSAMDCAESAMDQAQLTISRVHNLKDGDEWLPRDVVEAMEVRDEARACLDEASGRLTKVLKDMIEIIDAMNNIPPIQTKTRCELDEIAQEYSEVASWFNDTYGKMAGVQSLVERSYEKLYSLRILVSTQPAGPRLN